MLLRDSSATRRHINRIVSEIPERFLCAWDRYGNEQIRFAERCQGIIWEDLAGFGPNPNPKWRLNIAGHRAVFDDVHAGPFHLMELKVKILKSKGDEVYEKTSRCLRERGISCVISRSQER